MPAKNQLTDALENAEKENKVKETGSETGKQSQYLPPSRHGKKQISGYFDTDVHYQMKALSLETGKSIQALLGESLNYLFQAYDKPPISGQNV